MTTTFEDKTKKSLYGVRLWNNMEESGKIS